MGYTTDPFADGPSGGTPITATHLNEINTGLVDHESRLTKIEAEGKMPTGYHFTASPAATGSNSGLGVGTMRAYPWIATRATTLTKIGAEVTVIGDAGSKVRLGIYNDNGGLPGTLLVDAGQIAGDSATVQELTISQAITPGVYWMAAVIQSVTTTQPTLRAIPNTWTPPIPMYLGTGIPSTAGLTVDSLGTTGITGALPSTWSSILTSTTAARLFVCIT